jgi:small-conductance mechanosensitive channel
VGQESTSGTETIPEASPASTVESNSATSATEVIDAATSSPNAGGIGDGAAPVTLGGETLFNLQPFSIFSGRDRVESVLSRIEVFLQSDPEGRIRLPEVRARLDDNQQYVLTLREAGNPTTTAIELFTITRTDAEQSGEKTLTGRAASMRDVAQAWAAKLQGAIERERELRLAQQQARRPLSLLFGLLTAISVGIAAAYTIRLSDRGILRLRETASRRLSATWEQWIDMGAALCEWIVRLAVGFSALDLALRLVPVLTPFRQELYSRLTMALAAVWGFLNQPLLPQTQLSVIRIVIFAILAVLVFGVAGNLTDILRRRFLNRLGLDMGMQETAATVSRYLLTLMGILIVLPFIGIDLSSLTLVAGAVGLGIGIGLQNLSNNFISGLVVLFERPIQVGDFVEVDGLLGTVERISLRATIIRTLDRVNVIVPNSRFMESNVVSWSYRDPRCRIHIPVGVAYGSDTEAVTAALLQVAQDNARVLDNPPPQVLFKDFGESSLNFDLLVWTSRPHEQFLLISDLNYAIDAEFRRRQIEIPFPQRDLNIRAAAALRDILSPPPNGAAPLGEGTSPITSNLDPTE